MTDTLSSSIEASGSPLELGNRFRRVTAARQAAEELDFSILIPRSFQEASTNLQAIRNLRPLYRAVAPNGIDAEVNVLVCQLGREVNAADWLVITWQEAKGTILHRRDRYTPVGTTADMLIHHVGERGASIYRDLVVKDGTRIVRVEGRAAEGVYPELAGDLFLSVTSFQLLHPTEGPTAEPLIETSQNAVVPFRFLRLSSWGTSTPYITEDRCVLPLTSRHGEIEVGRIVIEVRKRRESSRLEVLAHECAQHLRTGDLHLGGAPVVPVTPPAGFQAAAIYAPAARYQGHEFDSPVLLLQHAEALVALSLFGPTRQESPEWWAINKRAFEIVRDSLVIGNTEGPP